MTDSKKLTICCCDCGLHVGFAAFLAREGHDVIYVNRWQASYAYSAVHDVGEGIEGVKVYDTIAATIEDDQDRWREPSEYDDDGYLKDPAVDLFVTMDLGYADDTVHLRALGYKVFGAGQGEKLEYDRIHAKALFEKLGLPVGPYEVVKGVDLRDYIRLHSGTFYVKGSSKVRGDMESRRIGGTADLDDWIRADVMPFVGSKFDRYPFVVEKAMDDIVEAAFDAFCVDGAFPSSGLLGIEQKGVGYCGHFSDDIPSQFSEVNRALASYLKRNVVRSFMAIETLIDKDATPFPTDPSMRGSLPAQASIQCAYSNLVPIMSEGARGILVEPKKAYEWLAEYVILSGSHKEQSIEVPEELRPNVRIVNYKMQGGLFRWMPQPKLKPSEGLETIGTVVGYGSTMEKACDMAKRIAKEITGKRTNLEFDKHALEEIGESFEALEKRGVPLG